LAKSDRNRLELDGEVVDTSKSIFKVKVAEDTFVTCTLSGKIRQNFVRILVGDKVRIEVSEYDTSKGRIVFRNKS
jgi:translation initiation factor IF-1